MIDFSSFPMKAAFSTSRAEPIKNQDGRVISKGNNKARIHLIKDSNQYSIAVHSSFSLKPVKLNYIERLYMVVLKIKNENGDIGYVKVNANSLKKRLNITKKEFNQLKNSKPREIVYEKINKLFGKASSGEPTIESQKLENANKKEVSKSVTIGPVSEVSPGVYTAEGKTEKGENIYFGMELIDNASREIWRDYSNAAYILSKFLQKIVSSLDDESKLKNLQQRADSGLSEEEFKDLKIQFRKRGLHPQGRLAEAISDIPGGIDGFMIEPNMRGPFAPATYVAYISKTPITGPLALPKTESKKSNFKTFKEKYTNILMSVGVRLDSNKPLFENRGIFRNPCSVIEGGYSNISTQLHAFTGKVMKEYINQTLGDNEKLYMSVSPINNMKELLVEKIGLERIKTKEDIPEELRIISSGPFEEQFLISLEDLANLH